VSQAVRQPAGRASGRRVSIEIFFPGFFRGTWFGRSAGDVATSDVTVRTFVLGGRLRDGCWNCYRRDGAIDEAIRSLWLAMI
jgi:hypothetical protein